MLARWTDEQSREEVRERRMVVPVSDEALEQIRPPENGAVRRGRAADDDVIPAAGAGVAAIEHELFGPEPGLAGFIV